MSKKLIKLQMASDKEAVDKLPKERVKTYVTELRSSADRGLSYFSSSNSKKVNFR